MKILLTGAAGYVGGRLLPLLAESGHKVVALVRDKSKLCFPKHLPVEVVEADLLDPKSFSKIPDDIDACYYLVHSMRQSKAKFPTLEDRCITNLISRLKQTSLKQIIYLSGLSDDKAPSAHMSSRHHVEEVIKQSGLPYTIFRSGIILGAGSASLTIISDLVEKLPVMVAPRWVKNRTQPIAVYDVIHYLFHSLGNKKCLDHKFDIAGPDILTYKELLELHAKVRGLKRKIITVPVLTPRLSSYWLYLVTKTSFSLASSLVDSLRSESIAKNKTIDDVIPLKCLSCKEALLRAYSPLDENMVLPLWEKGLDLSYLSDDQQNYLQVAIEGCYTNDQQVEANFALSRQKLFSIGLEKKWYYWRWAWSLRAAIDRLFGGKGFEYGKRKDEAIACGDVIDFWKVLYVNRRLGRLILYAQMKLPGDAWLEFQLKDDRLYQRATFRPKGILGRLYWLILLPAHFFIFRGQVRRLSA